MLKLILTLPFVLMTLFSAAYAAEMIGFKHLKISDPTGTRPLHAAVWYPTHENAPLSNVTENPVFKGFPAIEDASPSSDPHGLILLSHGYGGTWRNLSWLVPTLIDQGYVVAAPDHPGTTAFDRSPEAAAQLWQRPRDLSRVLDTLLNDSGLAGKIDPARIAAIGHSLGGWTVMALGGARFNVAQFTTECATGNNPIPCSLIDELGIKAENAHLLESDLRDKRIKAVVSIDLGLARGFTHDSLSSYALPVMAIGANADVGTRTNLAAYENDYLATHLPHSHTQHVNFDEAHHFTFMQICKPGAVEMIEEESPGEGFVCTDQTPDTRQQVHERTLDLIKTFLVRSF